MKHLIIFLAAAAIVIAFTLVGQPAHSATSPLALTTVAPIQFPPSDFNVTGVRAGLMGHHRNVYGFDFAALGNITDQTFVGLAVSGIFNMTRGNTTALGLQAAGIANINANKTRVIGVQLAGLSNINAGESTVVGLQLALLANLSSHTTIYGVQAGLINKAHTVYGFQIGLYNYAESLHGIQIGLINVHRQGLFGISPFLNFGF